MPSARISLLAKAALVAPAALALGVYAPRVCRTVAAIGDSTELDTVALVRGVAHAPGFPLYVLVAEAFEALPGLPQIVWLNASSAVLHGAAVLLTTVAAYALTDSLVAATAGGLVLALARSFVLGSLYAEVFPLNDLFFAALLLIAAAVGRSDDGPQGDGGRHRTSLLAAMALVAGLASADQQIIVLSAPALLLLVGGPLGRSIRARPLRLLLYLGAFVGPLAAAYATLWRAAAQHPAVSAGDVHDMGSLVRHFTRGEYWDYWRRRAPERPGPDSGIWGREALFGQLVYDSLGPIASAAAACGVFLSLRRGGRARPPQQPPRRREALALLAAFLVSGPVFAGATVALFTMTSPAVAGIAERFVTMPLVAVAIFVSYAVGGVERMIRSRIPAKLAAGLLTAACAALVVVPMVPRALSVDLRSDRRGEALAKDLVDQTQDGAVVAVTGDLYVQAATYACTVLRACGSRVFVPAAALSPGWVRTQLAHDHPDLAEALEAAKGVATAHLFVDKLIDKRPVYVMPDFFLRDKRLRQYGIVPELLTARLFASTEAAAASLPGAYDRAKAVVDANGCAGCASYHSRGYEPREELLLRTAYATALRNMAAAAATVYRDQAMSQRLAAMADEMHVEDPSDANGARGILPGT